MRCVIWCFMVACVCRTIGAGLGRGSPFEQCNVVLEISAKASQLGAKCANFGVDVVLHGFVGGSDVVVTNSKMQRQQCIIQLYTRKRRRMWALHQASRQEKSINNQR